ncbi:MAG TPA: hypothetical protein VH092_06855 [Urbifossiella sp.]|nr:hypothetical protein [Urbifossiella sp.]
MDGANRLRSDLNAVRDAVCRPGEWSTPARFAERLADEAVAAFARRGVTSDDARQAVAGAARWVGHVLAPWDVGALRPWNYYVGAVGPGIDRFPGGRFEAEGAFLQEYHPTRRSLLAALAAAGEVVPPDIDRRARLAHHSWPRGGDDPVSQIEILGLARATGPESGQPLAPTDDPAARPADPSAAAPTPSTGTLPPSQEGANDHPPNRRDPPPPASRPTFAGRVGARISQIKTVPPPGLDPDLADAYTAMATAVRECTRLQATLPALWTDAAEYRRLAAAVHAAADGARTAYDRIDIRLRRAGGPGVMLDTLNDVLTFQGRAPLDPRTRPGGLNAIVTHLFSMAEEMFPLVEGRGVLERMCDQLAHLPPAPSPSPPPPRPEDDAGLADQFGDAAELIRLGREVWWWKAHHTADDKDRTQDLNDRIPAAERRAMRVVPFGSAGYAEWERRVKGMREACAAVFRCGPLSPERTARLDSLASALLDLERAAVAVCGASDPRATAAVEASSGRRDPSADAKTGATRRKPQSEPDGPFSANEFRFAGAEVRFGRADKQFRLVTALWDARTNRPAAPRPVDDVIGEVWGEENDTEDSTFRQLCSDTRRRLEAANCPLDIRQGNGVVFLAPLLTDSTA